MKSFVHTSLPARVVFGVGALDQVGAELERMGSRRALVLSTPARRGLAEEVARRLGPGAAGVFDGAAMHVPIEIASAALARAEELGADGCVAVGGGSTIGLGKAIALASQAPPLPVLAIPTTFAGSEMTPIYGITVQGQKRTGRDARVLPRTVLYDPRLLMTLPAGVAGPSGINAIAHCVEALYAEDANPITTLMAEEGIRALAAHLPAVVDDPNDLPARADALLGACLAGRCLGAVGMALHHKLCHTLGGSFDLSHGETHTVVLPHAVAYNRAAAPEAMARIARALGAARSGAGGAPVDDPAQGLYDLARALGAPAALRDLGMKEASLDEAARLALQSPYYNPRPVEYAGVRRLLQDAWEGRPPAASAAPG